MKLVSGGGAVALRSYSMWSMYLGLACLLIPNGLWAAFEIEADPYAIGAGALVFFVAGIAGRVIDQDQSGRLVRAVFLAIFVLGGILAGGGVFQAVAEDIILPDPPAQIEAQMEGPIEGPIEARLVPVMADPPGGAGLASQGLASDQEFLAIAVPFVARWEGLRLEAYRDLVGIWTVCYGETKGVRPGDRYTRAECEAMLAREILDYRRGLHVYFLPQTKAALLPAARDLAFVSLAYNAGIAGAGKSTAARRLNAGQVAAACEALTWWNKAGGKVVRGLVRRRADEYGLCMRGVA